MKEAWPGTAVDIDPRSRWRAGELFPYPVLRLEAPIAPFYEFYDLS